MKQKQKHQAGFSMLELIVVVAIIGILAVVSFARLPRDRIQMGEAARIISADLLWARSQAIKENSWLEIKFNPDNNSYAVYEDADQNGVSEGQAVLSRMLSSEYPLADFSESYEMVPGSNNTATKSLKTSVWFDVRGLPRNLTGTFAVKLTSGQNSSYKQCILLEPQGRVSTKECS